MNYARVLTVQEVADRLRIHPITVYRLIRTARLPAFRIGRIWRFNSEDLDDWIDEVNQPRAEKNHHRRGRKEAIRATVG